MCCVFIYNHCDVSLWCLVLFSCPVQVVGRHSWSKYPTYSDTVWSCFTRYNPLFVCHMTTLRYSVSTARARSSVGRPSGFAGRRSQFEPFSGYTIYVNSSTYIFDTDICLCSRADIVTAVNWSHSLVISFSLNKSWKPQTLANKESTEHCPEISLYRLTIWSIMGNVNKLKMIC